MKYTYLLWDLDGTLIDPKEGIVRCTQYALEKLNYPVPDGKDLDWIIGPPLFKSFYTLLHTEDDQLVQEAVRLYRERYSAKGIYEHVLYPGIRDLLSDLQKTGYINLLATSKVSAYAQRILQHFEIDRFFAGGRGSEPDGRLAEKPDLIRAILAQVPAASPDQCLMIGDRRYDIEGARANAIDVLSVGYGYGTREELAQAGPTYFLPTVTALRDFFFPPNIE